MVKELNIPPGQVIIRPVETIPPAQSGGIEVKRPLLETPENIKVILPDAVRADQSTGPSGSVNIRLQQQEGARRSSGKRQKRFDFQIIASLSPNERLPISALREKLGAIASDVKTLRGKAGNDEPNALVEERLTRGATEIGTALSAVYATSRRQKVDVPGTMQKAGLDRLLVKAFANGKLAGVQNFLLELGNQLKRHEVAGDDVKVALLAFDALLQKLALSGDRGQFDYSTQSSNKARNLLQYFASALHR
jgi:hypothetical protein